MRAFEVLGVPEDSDDVCLMLPFADFPGEPQTSLLGGEVQLQELEDSTETRSQLYLNADGTVSAGATDGPPPIDMCGLWQCGEGKFQMILQRRYSSEPSVLRTAGAPVPGGSAGASPMRQPLE